MKKALLILLLILCSCGGSKSNPPQVGEQIKDPLTKHTIKYWVRPDYSGEGKASINYLNEYDFYIHDEIDIDLTSLVYIWFTMTKKEQIAYLLDMMTFQYEFEAYEGDTIYLEVNSMSGNTDFLCNGSSGSNCYDDIVWVAAIFKDGVEWLRKDCTIAKANGMFGSDPTDCDSIILEGTI